MIFLRCLSWLFQDNLAKFSRNSHDCMSSIECPVSKSRASKSRVSKSRVTKSQGLKQLRQMAYPPPPLATPPLGKVARYCPKADIHVYVCLTQTRVFCIFGKLQPLTMIVLCNCHLVDLWSLAHVRINLSVCCQVFPLEVLFTQWIITHSVWIIHEASAI